MVVPSEFNGEGPGRLHLEAPCGRGVLAERSARAGVDPQV